MFDDDIIYVGISLKGIQARFKTHMAKFMEKRNFR